MKIRYFVVESGKLAKAEQALVEGVWRGSRQWPGPNGDLHLLTIAQVLTYYGQK